MQFIQTTDPKLNPMSEIAFASEKLDFNKNAANISPEILA
jgi:hypothetical protein